MTTHGAKKKTSNRIMLILCLALLSSPLAGCGVKPKHLSAPPGAENDGFPHTYPSDTPQR